MLLRVRKLSWHLIPDTRAELRVRPAKRLTTHLLVLPIPNDVAILPDNESLIGVALPELLCYIYV